MNQTLKLGDTATLTWVVDATMVITLGGDPRATVFSTPNMILLMERSAREALRPCLEPGEESVGIEVNVQHLASAPLGAAVKGVARITAIDGRRVSFDVEAWYGDRLIGKGTHVRARVLVSRLIENLQSSLPVQERSMIPAPDNGPLPSFETLTVAVSNRIATVTFNRPRSLNAVNVAMTADFERLLSWLMGHAEDVRVVLLTGSGTAFCAGDDVKELRDLSLDDARHLSHRQAEMYLTLERLPQVIIALVNGDALGAGCVAAYSADLRIACHSARFGMPEITLGWPPGYGLAQLTLLIGKARAMELCLTGRLISSATALEWGLVNEVVTGGSLLSRGKDLAERMLRMPAEALRATRRLIHLDEGQQPKVAYRADTATYIRCLELPDAREGLAAFAEKRAPKFTGR